MIMAKLPFNITKIHGDWFNDQDKQSLQNRGAYGNPEDVKVHPVSFKAWDDDDNLYFTGTVTDEPDDWEYAFEFCMHDSGTTKMVFYDRSTGKRIDEIS